MYSFQCPACAKNGLIQAQSKEFLDSLILEHIADHETRAAIRAVDRARLECLNPECCLGLNKSWNFKNQAYEPKLTKFDRDLLESMKVSFVEQDVCRDHKAH